MSSLCCQLMLHLNTSEFGVYHSGEPECVTMCHLADLHALQVGGAALWLSDLSLKLASNFLDHI